MSLHRAESPDWSNMPPETRNPWQRQAARTRGIITPGNFISLTGGLLVIYGLYKVASGSLSVGIITILFGRCADILDGIVAERTKTKSPLGEAIDATVDKILIGLALIILLSKHLLPAVVGLAIAIHGLYNIGLFIAAWRRKSRLHPSWAGKIAVSLEWLSVGLYLLAAQLKNHHSVASKDVLVCAAVSIGLFVIFAGWSSVNYYRYLFANKVVANGY